MKQIAYLWTIKFVFPLLATAILAFIYFFDEGHFSKRKGGGKGHPDIMKTTDENRPFLTMQ